MTIVINKATNHRYFVKSSMIIFEPRNYRPKTVNNQEAKRELIADKQKKCMARHKKPKRTRITSWLFIALYTGIHRWKWAKSKLKEEEKTIKILTWETSLFCCEILRKIVICLIISQTLTNYDWVPGRNEQLVLKRILSSTKRIVQLLCHLLSELCLAQLQGNIKEIDEHSHS